MISSYQRGHKIVFIEAVWLFADDLSPISILRPCKRCNQFPTPEGYDHCLGKLPGVSSACCGHGVEKPYAMFHEECAEGAKTQGQPAEPQASPAPSGADPLRGKDYLMAIGLHGLRPLTKEEK